MIYTQNQRLDLGKVHEANLTALALQQRELGSPEAFARDVSA